MIDPQSLTLKEAYDPYLVRERMMFLDGSKEEPLLPHYPDVNDPRWLWVIDFDHENTLIHVCVCNYMTLEAARAALLQILWLSPKVIKCGGVTDVMSEDDYKNYVRTSHNDQWGVNWNNDDTTQGGS